MNEAVPARPSRVLLYDGFCPFCNAAVRFVLRNDPQGFTRFTPLHGEYATRIAQRHPEIAMEDSAVLVITSSEGHETVALRSDAIIGVMAHMHGWRRISRILRMVPVPIRNAVYNAIAAVRSKISGRYNECPTPDARTRERFIP